MNPALHPPASATAQSPARSGKNLRLALILLAIVVGSLLFVSVQPGLYRAFCEWTGLYDIDRAQEVAASAIPGRPITLQFDANSHDGALLFRPETTVLSAKTGDIMHVVYRVENTLDRTVVGQAVPSYGPQYAGNYVKKLDCFCFKQQTFAPREVREMPVVFFLDTRLPEEVNTVTLSYTFFEVPVESRK
ncbi:MAG: Cytochrome c oxidase assembly protein CtaG [Candidatus Accumulibacter regalis]|uniref:Cytochrome c oxidase assembly protein CtaG n=1 Tax=Accumulibacter regalis TaxID=522306 RepID=A0A011RJD1_ACCRE|nr:MULTISPECIES: cytochrome c oxidase assembly protein [unclassified Candidatus Accumulibacter]EXI91284.1 MAG: Cytochrome c oxidase assembly protein CtaG [Candidatus Accumulibacter regalis]HRE70053.1 cytochrome c oxidase assembly protein [Accumulibacter sp.]HRE84783.1 cytochrome c oxidase assembly protein [Accumulibacter sp.]HRI91330.1 cytochrome c oxidase assembly protein [Accumulibacter sp.]